MYITFARMSGTIVLGPTWQTQEGAQNFVKARGKNWSWVQVMHEDDTFGGYIL